MKRLFLLTIAVGAVATAIPAAGARQRAEPAAQSTYDPNRIICSRQRETGSRVLQRRVCMPARDWDTFYREQRQAIDRAQTSRVHPNG